MWRAAFLFVLVICQAVACTGPSDCMLEPTCDRCVGQDGCAWCFETNECLAVEAMCSGDQALTLEQCEAEEVAASAPDDAASPVGIDGSEPGRGRP